MTSKKFVLLCIVSTMAACASILVFNFFMDDFGLYRTHQAGERRVWTYNRATKYLFSLKYIPENFDAILIGSSSSAAMVDTHKISDAATYNLSMNGANICEVAPAALNALNKGKMRYLIVCLDPYLTKNSMMKTSELNPQLQKSALGSLFTLKLYLYKLVYTLFPSRDSYRDSWWGYKLLDGDQAARGGNEQANTAATESESLHIDDKALECLEKVLDTARSRGTKVLAYFHPRFKNDSSKQDQAHLEYKAKILRLFRPQETVLDLNGAEFGRLTGNSDYFHDGVHLTAKGGEVVCSIIERMMKSRADQN